MHLITKNDNAIDNLRFGLYYKASNSKFKNL